MIKKKESRLNNTKIAIVFFALLTFIIAVSLIFKMVSVIRAGQFDDSKRFTLTVTNGKSTEIMSLYPSAKTIAVFKLNDDVKPEEAGKLLEVPIDGFVMSNFLDLSQKVNSLFMKAIFNYNSLKTNLTIIDLFKIVMITRIIPENSVSVKTVGDTSGLESDKIVGHLVADDLIEKDRQTIQIINGTGVSGLGNRLARFITNMGGDVIIVATSDSSQNKSRISYIDKKTYTAERLQKVLGYEAVREAGNAISDITIVVGSDKINSAPF